MRKHLFSFIAAASLLFAGGQSALADGVTFGYTNPSGAETLISGDDNVTVALIKGTGDTGTSKELYFSSSTSVTYSFAYRDKLDGSSLTAKSEKAYFGFSMDVAEGHLLSLSGVSLKLGTSQNFSWNLSIFDEGGTQLYTSGDKAISSFNSTSAKNNTFSATLSGADVSKLSGKIYVKLFYWYSSSGSKYINASEFKVTGTVEEGQASTPTCKNVTFTKNAQFDFAQHAYTVSLSSTTPDVTIKYTTSTEADATLENEYTTALPISAEGTTIKAQASREGYDDSEVVSSGELKAAAAYDANKKYVAWVYEEAYTNNSVTYVCANDPLYKALAADYNVVPVNFSAKGVKWSDECATLDKADVVVMTEAVTGDGALCVSLKSLAGVVPMVNMKAYSYTSGRWSWGTPGAPKTATSVITPAFSNFKLFEGTTPADDGTITLANEGSTKPMVQTVSGLGDAVPGIPTTIATCGDNIAIYASGNYLLYALNANSFTYYNENAAAILKNAVARLAEGKSLTEMSESTVCAEPQYAIGAIDMSTYKYQLTLTALDNSNIYYKRADGVETLYEEPILLARKEVVTAIAKADGKTSSQEVTITAPDLSGEFTETTPKAPAADVAFVGTCYTIPSTYVGGSANTVTGVKINFSNKAFIINVNTGCIIQKIVAKGGGNSGTFVLGGVYVDGSEESLVEETSFMSSSDSVQTLTLENLNAESAIKFAIDSSTGYAQANFNFTFTYVIPEDPTTLHTVTFSADVDGFATFCPEKNVIIPEGVTAYIAKAENNALTLTEIEKYIPANTGVILKGTAGETAEFVTTGYTVDVTGNELTGVTKAATVEANSVYGLSVKDNVVAFYKYTGTTIEANKAYYKAPAATESTETSTAASAAVLRFNFGQEDGEMGNVTGINAVTIENRVDNVIYDLRGRRVQSLDRPGLYIVNGKKVAIQ